MNTVKIGGNKIKLVYSSPNDWNVNGLGRCYVDKIVINEELNNDMKANTFLHELLHYIVDLNGLVIQDNETEVSVLANVIHAFINDNKKLVKQIWGL